MDQEKLNTAKSILNHLGIKAETLPDFVTDAYSKQIPCVDLDNRVLAHYEDESMPTLRTVRFLKDFSRFGAGIHLETTNKSFLRTAELFRQMGIKNYFFMLQLNNPLLKDVDPWDPDLTDEQKFMILQESQENIWFTLRELIKIDGRRFQGNRAVISFVWSCLNHIPTLILMPRQSGKAMYSGANIKVPGGWSCIKDIKVGDRVTSKDGSLSNVTGVFPQGTTDIYRVHFVDGRTADCCGEHLWTVWDAGKGRRGKWRVMDTLSIMERIPELKRARNHLSVPLIDPDKTTPPSNLPLHPYLLGVLLGDGSLGQGSVSITKPDPELQRRVSKILPKGYVISQHSEIKRFGIVKGEDFDSSKHTSIQDLLRELKLHGTNTFTKFIPECYKLASHGQRLRLLQGLMDTDGTAEKGGNTYYSTSNEQLANDVLYLARSLGNIARIKKEQKYYTHKGERKPGQPSYRVLIRSREPWDLFQDPKRKARVQNCTRGLVFNSKLAIYSVEKLPEQAETICIEIDHPDQLYIVDDFVVTHNTVGMQVMAFILQYIIGRGYRSGLITLAASNRMQFINALKKIRAGLPEYMINMNYKDKDAGNILSYQAFGQDKENTFEVKVPSGGEDGAENVSRGNTFETLLYDEPAWTKYIENIINGAGPSTLTAQKNAREKGIPYFTAKATTPNSILKDEGKYMHEEMLGSTEWREVFFDCYSETHLVEKVMKASPVKTTYPKFAMQFNHLQLGFGHDWVKRTMDKLGLSWAKAKIDLLLMWSEEGKNKLFDDKTREKLNDSKVEPIWNEEINDTGLFVDWFVTKERLDELVNDPTEFILMGVDTSDAINKDACTLVLRRMKTGENIGVGRYPLAFLDDVTTVLREMILRIENSLLIIERNRAAHMIEQLLLTLPSYGIDPFKRIFNDIYQDPIKYRNEYRDVQEVMFKFRTKEFYLKHKARFGFLTNAETRRQMYGFILEAVSNTGSGIRYGHLVDELIGLETDMDGRIDHGKKGHDDLVIAWLLSYWAIRMLKNSSLYGIPPGQALTQISTLTGSQDGENYTKDQLELFMLIKERIEQLSKELEDSDSDMVGKRIELEIRKLSEFIPKGLKKVLTIDEIINNASAERSKRAINRRFNR